MTDPWNYYCTTCEAQPGQECHAGKRPWVRISREKITPAGAVEETEYRRAYHQSRVQVSRWEDPKPCPACHQRSPHKATECGFVGTTPLPVGARKEVRWNDQVYYYK